MQIDPDREFFSCFILKVISGFSTALCIIQLSLRRAKLAVHVVGHRL